MSRELTITVNGLSVIHRQAERAVLHVRVSSEGQSQTKVSEEVTQTANDLQRQFKSLAAADANQNVAVTHWSMSTLYTVSYNRTVATSSLTSSFTSKSSTEKQSTIRIYIANTTFEVKFKDFARLSSVATALSQTKHVSVQRIEWKLTDITKASLASQSRTAAVKDAVVKATDYARAAGRRDVVPIEIDDSGRQWSNSGGMYAAARSTAFGKSAGPSEEELSFFPEDVNLECSVTAKFVAVD